MSNRVWYNGDNAIWYDGTNARWFPTTVDVALDKFWFDLDGNLNVITAVVDVDVAIENFWFAMSVDLDVRSGIAVAIENFWFEIDVDIENIDQGIRGGSRIARPTEGSTVVRVARKP